MMKEGSFMSQKNPQQILEATIDSAVKKTGYSVKQLILLGLMAGFFIAIAGAVAS